jgi:diaminopimelate epimerase
MRINFLKLVGNGNDFVLIDCRRQPVRALNVVARRICNRKYGIGADGLLVLESSKRADARMRIFNSDGSEAEMCGNGARCAAYYLNKANATLDTKAGIIRARLKAEMVKIRLTNPKPLTLNMAVQLKRKLRVNFINTGVPHVVVFVHGLDKIDVPFLGRILRNHKKFSPGGTNVNFVETFNSNTIRVRTYERGVEDETLACGTGSVASALVFAANSGADRKIKVITASGEILNVYFNRDGLRFSDVWLEGKVKLVCKGVYNV